MTMPSTHARLADLTLPDFGMPEAEPAIPERGDPFTVAFGVWGALDCRAGFVVEDATELPASIADYAERLVAPYFEAVAAWYVVLRPDRAMTLAV